MKTLIARPVVAVLANTPLILGVLAGAAAVLILGSLHLPFWIGIPLAMAASWGVCRWAWTYPLLYMTNGGRRPLAHAAFEAADRVADWAGFLGGPNPAEVSRDTATDRVLPGETGGSVHGQSMPVSPRTDLDGRH